MCRFWWRLVLGLVCSLGVAPAWAADAPGVDGAPQNLPLFDQLDANHDGQISRDEIPEGKQAKFGRLLSSADRDANGRLSREEFDAGLESRRPKRAADEKLPAEFGGLPQPAAMDEMFRKLDRNQDGKVVADEVPDEFRPRFDRLVAMADKDNDGAITQEEIHQALARVGQQLAGKPGEMDPARVFEYLDRNVDGKLTTDEIPSERKAMFERAMKFGDRDGDGALSQEEFTKVVTAWRKRQERQEPAPKSSAATPPAGQRSQGPRLIHRLVGLDSDHDGKVSRAEFSGQGKVRFTRVDANQDGFLDRGEIEQFAATRAAKMGDGQPNGGQKGTKP